MAQQRLRSRRPFRRPHCAHQLLCTQPPSVGCGLRSGATVAGATATGAAICARVAAGTTLQAGRRCCRTAAAASRSCGA
eukprot:7385251-Prymnesium_polylepis.1